MSEAPRVIINADDFGFSPMVNEGIVEAHRDGVLSSTTAMTTMAHFPAAAEMAKQTPTLGVGLHFTLIWGKPKSPPEDVPSLVDSEGMFPQTLGAFVKRLPFMRSAELRREAQAQLDAFKSAGLPTPTHIDSHKHTHGFRKVFKALVQVANDAGIRSMRVPREAGFSTRPGVSLGMAVERHVMRFLCRDFRATLTRYGMKTSDHFAGLDYVGSLDANGLSRILERLPGGVTEIMCHPGRTDPEPPAFGKPLERGIELAALTDERVRCALEKRGAVLCRYDELGS